MSYELELAITEDDVKRSTLRFLKAYYKFRPRKSMETKAQLDLAAPGGILADGHLTFEKEDGSIFVATFEATSYDSRKEVIYQVQDQLLFWDGLAISGMLTTIFFTYQYISGGLGLKEMDMLTMIAFTWLVLLSILGLFRVSVRGFKRYHYIYAIEQFKQYHADEQWIALAYNVFESSDDRRFQELKDQCLKHGFGLLVVSQHLEPLLVITPSRESTFKRKRRRLTFITQPAWAEQLTNRIPGRKFLRRFKFTLDLDFFNPEDVSRFKRSYNNQMLISLIASLGMIGLFIQKQQDAKVRYADREEILTEQLSSFDQQPLVEEPSIFEIDTAFLDQFEDYDQPYLLMDVSREEQRANPVIAEAMRGGIKVLDESARVISYDCARFFNAGGPKFLLIEDVYVTESEALRRLQVLREVGLLSGVIWEACIKSDQRGFLVYLGLIYNNRLEAEVFQAKIRLYLTSKRINTQDIYIEEVVFQSPD